MATNIFGKLPSFKGMDYKWYKLCRHYKDEHSTETYADYLKRNNELVTYTEELVTAYDLYIMDDGVMAIPGELMTYLVLQLPEQFYFEEV